jgi:predicted dehydrogenase
MSEINSQTSRRSFLAKSTLAAAGMTMGLSSNHTRAGKNEKIRLGFIGLGNRGTQLLSGFLAQSDAEVVALCDVYEPYLNRDRSSVDQTLLQTLGSKIPKMDQSLPQNVARYKDFRSLLDRKDIDAVVISTPDHWHAIQTIMACQAGKDVYVEKPLSITIHEGRKMVEAAKKYNRIVQVGLHRRSSNNYKNLAADITGGKIGKVTTARAYRISNMSPAGIGRFKDSSPPKGFDWNLWLGPREKIAYKDNIAFYKFRWWQDYSSQMGNWGVHYCDAIRWMLGEQAPVSISAHGGRFAVNDDRTIPDTMEAIFEMPSGCLINFGQYEASGGAALHAGEIELRGTLGNLYSSEKGFEIVPSKPGQFQSWQQTIAPEQKKSTDGSLTNAHIRNFLDCIRKRNKCNCDLETGHRSTTFAHLANIALATRSRIEWDPKNERITNNAEANELLHYEYRKPWKL